MPLIMFDDGEGGVDTAFGYAFCSDLMAQGIYFHPWHNMFMSAALTEADIDAALEAADAALGRLVG